MKPLLQKLLCASLLLVTGGPLLAATTTSTAETSTVSTPDLNATTTPTKTRGLHRWPHAGADLAPDPVVTWGRLSNGMGYAIMPNANPPGRVSLRIGFDVGSLHEIDSRRGLAHFLEHMAFKGSENIPPGELIKRTERVGMAFGPDTNAYTGFDQTVYQLELPGNAPEMVDEWLGAFRELADRLLLDEKEIEPERGVILSEKRVRDSAQYRAFVASIEFSLAGTLFPARLPIGIEETIRSVSKEDFVAHYRAYYRPENTVVAVIGSINPEDVTPLIEKHFASWTPFGEAGPEPDFGVLKPRGVQAKLHYEANVPTTVSLQTTRPRSNEPDSRERRLRRRELDLANAMISRRLEKRAKQEGAPFVEGEANTYNLFNYADLTSVDVTCKPEEWEEGLAVVEQELRRALSYGFTEPELAEQKAMMLNTLEQAAKGAATRQSSQIAYRLVSGLMSGEVFTSPEDDLTLGSEHLDQITAEGCQAALQRAWDFNTTLIMVTGEVKLDDAEGRLVQAYFASRGTPVQPPVAETLKPFAYTSFGTPQKPASREDDSDLNLTRIRFPNQVRLNVRDSQTEQNRVLVKVRFGGGLLDLPTESAALKLLFEKAFVEGGLEQHSHDELHTLMAGKQIEVFANVQEDAFELTARTNQADLARQMQLLCAYLTAPGFRDEAYRQYLKGLDGTYHAVNHTVEGVNGQEVARFLHDGDARFSTPEREQAEAATFAQLKEWLKQPLQKSYVEITVCGDLKVTDTIQAVSETFGSLPMRAAKKPTYKKEKQVRFPRRSEPQVFSYETEVQKASAVVYWPTTDATDRKRARRLSVLARVLSRRLLDVIRTEEGETYSPYAQSLTSEVFPGYGYLFAGFDADPAKAIAMTDRLATIAAQMSTEGITQDELDRVIQPLLKQWELALQRNQVWVENLLKDCQERPERLEIARTVLADLATVNLDEINTLASLYLQPEKVVKVAVVPKKAEGK